MLISPLHFKEFDASSLPTKEVRKRPFAEKKKEEIAEAPPPPPPPTFSEDELRAAERDAYQKGFLEGTKEGHAQAQNEQAEVDRVLLEGLENFVHSITPIFNQYRSHCLKLKQDMPTLALAIAKKVAGEALSNDLQITLDNAAKQCAEAMIHEPQISVTVHTSIAPALSNKFKYLSMREQAASAVTVIADEHIVLSDYKIEWKNGSIERNTEKLWQQMEKVISNMLSAIANEKEEQLDLLKNVQN